MLAWEHRGSHSPVRAHSRRHRPCSSGVCAGPGVWAPRPPGAEEAPHPQESTWGRNDEPLSCRGPSLGLSPPSRLPGSLLPSDPWQTPGPCRGLPPQRPSAVLPLPRASPPGACLEALGILLLHLWDGRGHLPLHLQKLLQVGAGLRVDDLKVDPERHRGPGGIR